MSTDDPGSDDSQKANDFLGQVRDLLKGPPPELGRPRADMRAYLLVTACLICGIVGAWMVVKNLNMYEYQYRPGYQVLLGLVAGFLATSLGWHTATTYKQPLIAEILAWAGFSIGLTAVLWLAVPFLRFVHLGYSALIFAPWHTSLSSIGRSLCGARPLRSRLMVL